MQQSKYIPLLEQTQLVDFHFLWLKTPAQWINLHFKHTGTII